MKKKIISLVVTCYNEEENISLLYERVVHVFKNLPSYDFELLYVDNSSTDRSVRFYENLAKKDKRVKIIIMSRNFGSPQPSFLAGLSFASGEAAVLLHGDIQDPPELIPEFITRWEQGYDVVFGVRTKREGYGALWNFYYKVFYFLLQKLAYIPIPLNAGDFSLLSKRVVQALLSMPEYDYYLRCLRAFVGFPQIGVEYARDARLHGRSNESFLTGVWWAKTIIFNFSFKPLTIISIVGMFVTCISFLFLIINVFLVTIYHTSAPGIPTVIVIVLFLGGVQLMSLSVIAEYIAKIFLEVKNRPRYIVKETVNLSRAAHKNHDRNIPYNTFN